MSDSEHIKFLRDHNKYLNGCCKDYKQQIEILKDSLKVAQRQVKMTPTQLELQEHIKNVNERNLFLKDYIRQIDEDNKKMYQLLRCQNYPQKYKDVSECLKNLNIREK